MPSSRIKTAQNLEDRYLDNAPKKNHEKISIVLEIYRGNKKVKKHTAETVLMALYLPRAFGHVGNKRKGKPDKADDIYEDFVSKYKNYSADIEKPKINRIYELRVVLYTQARKMDPNTEKSQ